MKPVLCAPYVGPRIPFFPLWVIEAGTLKGKEEARKSKVFEKGGRVVPTAFWTGSKRCVSFLLRKKLQKPSGFSTRSLSNKLLFFSKIYFLSFSGMTYCTDREAMNECDAWWQCERIFPPPKVLVEEEEDSAGNFLLLPREISPSQLVRRAQSPTLGKQERRREKKEERKEEVQYFSSFAGKPWGEPRLD